MSYIDKREFPSPPTTSNEIEQRKNILLLRKQGKVKIGFSSDLEGTLINLEGFHFSAWERVLNARGLDLPPNWFKPFAGVGDAAIANHFAQILNEPDAYKIRREKKDVFDDLKQTDDIALRPGVMEFLRSAYGMGIPIVISSLTPKQDALYYIDKTGLGSIIETALTVEDVDRLKPFPDVYLQAYRFHSYGFLHASLRRMPIMVTFEDSPAGANAVLETRRAVEILHGQGRRLVHLVAMPVLQDLQFPPEVDYLGEQPKTGDAWEQLTPESLFKKLSINL